MSTLLKKIAISFFASLAAFIIIAPNFSPVNACVTNFECAANPNASGCIPNPNAGPGQQKTICGTAVTTGVSNAVSNALSGGSSESTWYSQGPLEWYNKVFDQSVSPGNEIFGERYTAAQVQWVMYSVPSVILNMFVDPQITSCVFTNFGNVSSCLEMIKQLISSDLQTTPLVDKQQPSLISLVFADRPVSGISYIKNRLTSFSLVPEVHAQGFGYRNALDRIQGMWAAFRNIAFGLFVVVAIVFAFMIMFRVKISPQVVITVQSAIPKLIITIILVTFSYAIAGLLIDLMYVVIGLLSVALTPLIPVNFLQTSTYNTADVFKLLTAGYTQGKIFGIQSSSIVGGVFNLLAVYLTPLTTLGVLVLFTSIVVSFASLGTAAWIFLLAIITLAIAFIILLWMSIKIIYALFKAFAYIVLLTIFAPLQITIGMLVPNMGFGQWIKSYISYLSVFVVTGVMWLFAWIFNLLAWDAFWGSGGSINSAAPSGSWPPLLGSSGFGLSLVYTGASFVMFILIPKATEIVQGFISGKPFAYGTAVGEAIGAPGRGAMAAMNLIGITGKTYGTLKEWGFFPGHPEVPGPVDPRVTARLDAQRRSVSAARQMQR